jgi:hypothetical protein
MGQLARSDGAHAGGARSLIFRLTGALRTKGCWGAIYLADHGAIGSVDDASDKARTMASASTSPAARAEGWARRLDRRASSAESKKRAKELI